MKRLLIIVVAAIIAIAGIAAIVIARQPSAEQKQAFYWAIREGDVPKLRTMLDENPRLANAKHKDHPPLVSATGIYSPVPNRNQLVELLLERGAEPNYEGWRPLSGCIYSNDADCIQLLLNHGADPLLKDKEGKTALDYARSHGAEGIAAVIEAHLKAKGITPAR